MQDFRCGCKKIVFQVEGDSILIKCRHCKRYIQINTKGIVNFQYKLGPDEEILKPQRLPNLPSARESNSIIERREDQMLRNIFGKVFVEGYRVLFAGAFVVLNLIGILFIGAIGYFLIFQHRPWWIERCVSRMLKRIFAQLSVQVVRICFVIVFTVISLAGIAFLGLMGYHFIF